MCMLSIGNELLELFSIPSTVWSQGGHYTEVLLYCHYAGEHTVLQYAVDSMYKVHVVDIVLECAVDNSTRIIFSASVVDVLDQH